MTNASTLRQKVTMYVRHKQQMKMELRAVGFKMFVNTSVPTHPIKSLKRLCSREQSLVYGAFWANCETGETELPQGCCARVQCSG